MLAVVGRFLAVVAPVQAAAGPSASDFVVVAIASAIWFVTLDAAYGARKISALTLGIPLTSALGTFGGLLGFSVLNRWLPVDSMTPLRVLALTAAVYLFSVLFETLAKRRLTIPRRVLVVGSSAGAVELAHEIRASENMPFECVGLVGGEYRNGRENVPRLGLPSDLTEIVRREQPDVVVLADGRADALEYLLNAASLNFAVVGLPEFYEHAFGRVPIRHLSPVWFMSILHLYRRPYSRITKRIVDLIVAGTGLLVTAPLMPLVAWLVRLSGPGPILFRQARLGEAGTPFEMLKFRTMVDTAERPGEALWASENDPRVTMIGRVLRATRLDELPQIWNVLRGDMSVIGPRPERPEFLELLRKEVPFWTRRHLVKPGITGWAQVHLGYTSDADGTAEKLAYDLFYLKHRSLVLDLAILAKTVPVAISGAGAR
jgi:exopolysaccharide biosynthesis polyprenyl glycosylphosphotransferase